MSEDREIYQERKTKIIEVHIWSNGNVSFFTDDKSQIEGNKGCLFDQKTIEIINKYCDENTKFSFGKVGSHENMIGMDMRWWFPETKSERRR